jgi:hypothetical protein
MAKLFALCIFFILILMFVSSKKIKKTIERPLPNSCPKGFTIRCCNYIVSENPQKTENLWWCGPDYDMDSYKGCARITSGAYSGFPDGHQGYDNCKNVSKLYGSKS